ncbi:MAG: pyridoxamine 5'-phosphate oxidase family protein [Synechococcus sp. BS307-5m-G38]|nr:pyridoxamine 5'-phosphate oxidase family protein [Synechococcus sp. BS307-5m-G38]
MTSFTAMPLPPWRARLRGAREREGRQPAARWLQLASVAADGTPRVRTLVFRGWAAADQLELFTDGRSAKSDELIHQPQVELCWLLSKARHQYRLRGQMTSLSVEEAEPRWKALSPKGRALWGWPHPGRALQPEAAFPLELSDAAAMPDHFLVLQLTISRVELLDLNQHPHQRLLWCASDGWAEQRLNP